MKTLCLIFGIVLAMLTLVWFFYFVPLGCHMNTTGCKETFSLLDARALLHFWAPMAVAALAMVIGARKR